MAIRIEYADVVMETSQRDEEFFIKIPFSFDVDEKSYTKAIEFFKENGIAYKMLTGFFFPGAIDGLRYIWADIPAGTEIEKLYSSQFEDEFGQSLPSYNFQAVYISKSEWEANQKEVWDDYKLNGDKSFD